MLTARRFFRGWGQTGSMNMTAIKLLNTLKVYLGEDFTRICLINSGCAPNCNKTFKCGVLKSVYPVLDFDGVKNKLDKRSGKDVRKSADAVCVSGSQQKFCMIEMKSWEMYIEFQCKSKAAEEAKEAVYQQADKYEKDLPGKLQNSIEICNEIAGDSKLFDDIELHYIMLGDTDPLTQGIESIAMGLATLATTSSYLESLCLRSLCDKLSQEIMDKIKDANPHYWNCRDFDTKIRTI